ncbi:transposase [Thermomonas aquatica]|uniref:transposase n=1 Tax=Thermomonas aquatica TaxID=2202149 RepID=UPI00143E091F|nr:transposase [Thermomonas aquatica]
MAHYKYDAETKARAVRRVVRDGRSVSDAARECGVSEGSLFFWLRRYRQLAANQQRLSSLSRDLHELEERVRAAERQLQLRDLHASNAERLLHGDVDEAPPRSLVAYLRLKTA